MIKKQPSNKKDGSTYLLKSFTKEQLVSRCLETEKEKMDLEDAINSLKNELSNLTKEHEKLKRKMNKLMLEEDVIKIILEYRARNYSPVLIRDKLKLQGYEIDSKSIKDVINGELSLDLEKYYNECKAKYIESIKINTNYYKQSSIDEIQRLIDSAYEDLENCTTDDIKTRDSLRNSIGNFIAKRDMLMKCIDENSELTEEEQYVNDTIEDYKANSGKIIKIYDTNIKTIGVN